MSTLMYNYEPVVCTRQATGANFPGGPLEFRWSVGGQKAFYPSKSFFRVKMSVVMLDGAAAAAQPNVASTVTFAENPVAGLFSGADFQVGNQSVSAITTQLAQIDSLKKRLTKSHAWMESIGASSAGLIPFDSDRLTAVASDAPDAGPDNAKNSRVFTWVPPLGIFDYEMESKHGVAAGAMAAGQYALVMTPQPDGLYQRSAAYATNANRAPGAANGFNLTVDEITFFAATAATPHPGGNYSQSLNLREIALFGKSGVVAGTASATIDYTIPNSTDAISVFAQTTLAGSDIRSPVGRFKGVLPGGGVNALYTSDPLRTLQISYAGENKPSQNYTSTQTAASEQLTQRYLDTMLHSGLFWSEGGGETLSEWLMRGGVYHYSWDKDASDRSTQAQVTISYDAPGLEANMNIFLAAWHNRHTQITVKSGFVTEVVSASV